jgi:hypothetical protein
MKNLEHGMKNSSESDNEENKEQDIHEVEAEEKMPIVEANFPLGVFIQKRNPKTRENNKNSHKKIMKLPNADHTEHAKKLNSLAYQHLTTRP